VKASYRVNDSRPLFLIGMIVFAGSAAIALVAAPMDAGRITVPMVGVGLSNVLVAAALARGATGGVIVSPSGVRIRNPLRTHRFTWEDSVRFVARPLAPDADVDIAMVLAEDRRGRSFRIAEATPPFSRLTLAAAAQTAHELNLLAQSARPRANESEDP